ncbi:MAG: hypothetical protein A3H06_00995 [Candidatus Colwellbacteria bacterium RIFCSPLOWO2_12_FULL_44_13]|uniref:Uncharacterized protein n=1 Tax=Candidatus Colwellbacteria bacterium RIFCSPLOWO2_12_FULL_44_13 TaxID=1797694 RepID=A0A1G1ZBN6_9BACT|nr:MAG: hypothetical protein A3H06_00995 [Candidatus Colwellbacteria bacterium RIFCSPLOWO2_12_FULL_44_13]
MKKKYDFNFFVLARLAEIRKKTRPHSFPRPLSAGGIQTRILAKNISRSFAKSFPQKIVFAKLRPFYRTAHFLPFEPFGDVVFPALSILESSVLRTEARSARGTPLITDFENRF